MNVETMIQLYNTLNLIEVKGVNNLGYLLGALRLLEKEIQGGEENGNTKQ